MNTPTPLAGLRRGFTLIELVIVMAIIAILALMAVPSLQESTIIKQVKEGMALADLAKLGVGKVYVLTGDMPANNGAAGVPAQDKIVGSMVTGVAVADGAVTITFGNSSNSSIHGKKLTLRPAIVADAPQVPISWVCNNSPLPTGMTFRGKNETDLPDKWLPLECRERAAK